MYDLPTQPGLHDSHPSSSVHVVVDEAQSQLFAQFSPQVPVAHSAGVAYTLLLLQLKTSVNVCFPNDVFFSKHATK